MLISLLLACGEPVVAPVVEPTPAVEPAPIEAPHGEVAIAPVAADASGWSHYGAPFATTETIAAATFLGDPSEYVGKTVRIEGKVSDVCQKAGCWMVIADGDKTLRVKMKDHGFSVDKAGAGCTASIEGVVIANKVDPKTTEHYAGEAANPAVMPENNAKDGQTFEIEAVAVAMKRG